MCIYCGGVVLAGGSLGAVGGMDGEADAFINALLGAVGSEVLSCRLFLPRGLFSQAKNARCICG